MKMCPKNIFFFFLSFLQFFLVIVQMKIRSLEEIFLR